MSKQTIVYNDFLETVPQEHKEYVNNLHEYLVGCGCSIQIKEARNGYVVSYIGTDKKSMANYIFRKNGIQMRIYANHIHQYPEVLGTLPDSMTAKIDKAGDCKRMLNPTACNSRCPMGYDFKIGEKRFQKCRNMAFLFPLSEENNPFLRTILEREAEALPD